MNFNCIEIMSLNKLIYYVLSCSTVIQSFTAGRAQPVIPPNLYSNISNVNEHNSLGSPGNTIVRLLLIV